MPLTVTKLKAKSGSEEDCAARCRGLVAPTCAEMSCITYDLDRSSDDPGLFRFTSSWGSRPLWEEHMTSPHLAASASGRMP